MTQDDRPQEVSKDAGEATADTKPEVAESDKKVDAQATDSPVEKPNQEAESSTDRDKIESREQSEKDSSKGGKPLSLIHILFTTMLDKSSQKSSLSPIKRTLPNMNLCPSIICVRESFMKRH